MTPRRFRVTGKIVGWVAFQQMQDDMIVNRYMATVDARIDREVLKLRVEIDSRIEKLRWYSAHNGWLYDTPRDRYNSHVNRDDDLQRLIEEIRAGDGLSTIDTERDFDPGFGPYDGNEDKYLTYVLDTAGSMFADEETGSTEWSIYAMRFGRCVLTTDDQGFRTLLVFDDEDKARAQFNIIGAAYDGWLTREES